AGACEAEPDKMGRMLLPQVLRDYAHLEGDAVVIGAGARAEIWSKSAWEEISTFDDVDELAEKMSEIGIEI
ncbi:MAG: division/cell wall cluster transcriptional repressor MraZ, partial [Lachnospiraceae bacterium]|nr:division/cell wall cluster transcriptional repressor MraZ [Lachnospiraceae bacterium]